MEGSSVTDHSKLKIKLRLVPKHEQQKVNHNENQDLVNPMENSSRATPAPVSKQEVIQEEEEDWEEGEIRDDEVAAAGGSADEEEDQGGDDASNGYDDVEDEEKVKGKSVVCIHCNKVFSGGKALGGHSRVHTANYKNEQNNKKKKRDDFMAPHHAGAPISPTSSPFESPEIGGGQGGELLFRCTLCPKEFPSEKSLYGHMRSHPERDYRGMKPPPGHHRLVTEVGESSSAWASTLSSLAELRLKRLWTWSVTGKRGRKSSVSETSSSSASYDSRAVVVAAENLVMLSSEGNSSPDDEEDEESKAKRARKGNGLMKHKDYDSDELYFLKKMGILIDDSLPYDDDDDNGMDHDDDRMFGVDVKPFRMISPPPSSSTKPKGGNYNKKISVNNGVIKKIKELGSSIDNQINASNYDEENNVWVCLTCGKTFLTHQALGGHRSSHNKEKSKIGNGASGGMDVGLIGDNGGGVSDGGGGGGGREEGQVAIGMVMNNFNVNDDVAQVIGLHKCKLCDKTFPTGQALGGHQRCHYVPSPEVSSSPGPSNAETGRRDNGCFEIDLNISLPMVESGDDVVESSGRD